jgi:hypothetical protein
MKRLAQMSLNLIKDYLKPSVDKDTEQWEFSTTAGRRIN